MVNQCCQQDLLSAPAQRRRLAARAALEGRGGIEPDADIGPDLLVHALAAKPRPVLAEGLVQAAAEEAAVMLLHRAIGDEAHALLKPVLQRGTLLGRLNLVRALGLP